MKSKQFRHIPGFLRGVKRANIAYKQRVYINTNIPYKSQWESSSLVSKIIHREIAASHDPLWLQSGASTSEEYEYWSWNICGMACLKSVLDYLQIEYASPLVQLAKRCSQFGGYVLKEKEVDGLFYKPFLDFIKADFNLEGNVRSPLHIEEIIEDISEGNFVIASVHPTIRDPKFPPPSKGGHLILIVGYDLEKERFVFHNPSGYENYSQAFASVSFSTFKLFFAERGIIITNPKNSK